MEGDEELLDTGRRWQPPRWARAGALALVVLVGGGIALARAVSGHRPPAAAPASTASSALPRVTVGPAAQLPAWPSEPGTCGTTVSVPFVRSRPASTAAPQVDARVMLGGDRLISVDFDSGAVRAVPGAALRDTEYVARSSGSDPHWLLAADGCGERSRTHPVHVDGSGRAVPGPTALVIDDVIADDHRAYGFTYPSRDAVPVRLEPLSGGAPVTLTAGVVPSALSGDVIVGARYTDGAGPAPRAEIVLLDAVTGRERSTFAAGVPFAVGAGQLVWSDVCDPAAGGICSLHARPIAGGATRTYTLPSGSSAFGGVLSADGHSLAFQLSRAEPDPRFTQDHPIGPSDLAVLDLASGRITVVPGIEIAPKTGAALAFTRSGWLLAAIGSGRALHLLAWRPGMDAAVESPMRTVLRATYVPAMVVLSP